MKIITRKLPEKDGLVESFTRLKLSTEALKLPKSRKNIVYATLSRLKKKKGFDYTTVIEGDNILVWRLSNETKLKTIS